jgi:hypothetical protein
MEMAAVIANAFFSTFYTPYALSLLDWSTAVWTTVSISFLQNNLLSGTVLKCEIHTAMVTAILISHNPGSMS